MAPEDPTKPLSQFEDVRDLIVERVGILRKRAEDAGKTDIVEKLDRALPQIQATEDPNILEMRARSLDYLELLLPPENPPSKK